MTNKESQILIFLPNMIILNTDMDGLIVNCYGDNINNTKLLNKYIYEVFTNEILHDLELLTSFKKPYINIRHENKQYEVSFRNILIKKIFYFYDITKHTNTI